MTVRSSTAPAIRRTEAIIIGSGIAGLAAALALAPLRTTLVTKTQGLAGGSSRLAQGGVAAAIGADDSPESHVADTIAAGSGLTDEAMARVLANEGVQRVQELIAAGLAFDADASGAPLLGREAAHSKRRILHAGGDATGRTLTEALARRVLLVPTLTVNGEAMALDLALENGRAVGVLAHHKADGWVLHLAPRIVLATGGIGAAYQYTTNPPVATGDGLAMAARAGARLSDLEFVQFHPTSLAIAPAATSDWSPLLTEALRGEGAHILDGNGKRFMPAEHPQAELAPRDVVARAVWRRLANDEKVFLDLRAIFAGDGATHFPTALAACRAVGLDPSRDLIPIAPTAHYHMGGIATDGDGRTSIPGLWACGEVAATGVHGANRLASNSLLEALVFGARAAEDMKRMAVPVDGAALAVNRPQLPVAPAEVPILRAELRRLMYEKVGLQREAGALQQGIAQFADMAARLDALERAPGDPASHADIVQWAELRNLILVARLIAHAALRRQESRGAHYRIDFPDTSPHWLQRQAISIADLTAPTQDVA